MEVQNHGLLFENEVITAITGMSKDEYQGLLSGSYTNSMDIAKGNHSDNNYSVKVTGNNSIGCGDILRFFKHCRDDEFTMVVGRWRQAGPSRKIYYEIYEFYLKPENHKLFFANLEEKSLTEFVDYVKSIPYGREGQLANRKLWKSKREDLYDTYERGLVSIDAKIDSKTQRRVQCSVKISDMINAGIKYAYYASSFKGIKLPYEQESSPRSFSPSMKPADWT